MMKLDIEKTVPDGEGSVFTFPLWTVYFNPGEKNLRNEHIYFGDGEEARMWAIQHNGTLRLQVFGRSDRWGNDFGHEFVAYRKGVKVAPVTPPTDSRWDIDIREVLPASEELEVVLWEVERIGSVQNPGFSTFLSDEGEARRRAKDLDAILHRWVFKPIRSELLLETWRYEPPRSSEILEYMARERNGEAR